MRLKSVYISQYKNLICLCTTLYPLTLNPNSRYIGVSADISLDIILISRKYTENLCTQ
jgi:hypothetical protein